MKKEILSILGKYKVIGDTTYGLGYKESNELVDEIIEEVLNEFKRFNDYDQIEVGFMRSCIKD